MKKIFLFAFLVCTIIVHAQKINIIPQPVSVIEKEGAFMLTKKTPIITSSANDKKVAAMLNIYLKSFYGFALPVTDKGSAGIVLKTNVVKNSNDFYELISDKNKITINGKTDAATFYGVQTLIQLLPVTPAAALQIPAVAITDEPALQYRGIHLDVGRHFFPVSYVKKYIDYLALHKINYFHWHLTEDQGWRIEIKKYPKLTSAGAWRNGTIVGHYPGTASDKIKHGGYYTQNEVKEIVAYAALRYITVIPEVEMPGHSSAAIAAYPYLSCFPGQSTNINKPDAWNGPIQGKQVQQTWGVFNDVFCAGKESTFKFLEDVLDEVLPLFPSKYVHVGGDECPKENWKKCTLCQQRMKENNLKSEHELQSYFIQRIEKYVNKKGKTLIGWDEILEGGLAPNAVVMSWRGEQGGIDAAAQNHQVIMTPGEYAYFDHSQLKKDDSLTIGGYLPLSTVYKWQVVPAALNETQKKYVLGGQANMWTEYIDNTSKADYMLFPRITALSEALWSAPGVKNWDNFRDKLKVQEQRYKLWGVNYCTRYE
jgi:hexosaminidase